MAGREGNVSRRRAGDSDAPQLTSSITSSSNPPTCSSTVWISLLANTSALRSVCSYQAVSSSSSSSFEKVRSTLSPFDADACDELDGW